MASLASKDDLQWSKPDKHHRETYAEDMERCTYLIRGKRQCHHRRTDGGTVCQLHEPSRLAKEQQLSVMKKRPRGEVLKEDENENDDANNSGDDDPLVPGKKRLSNVKRISSAQSRMFNGLCTPLEDHGVIGLPAPSSSSSSSSSTSPSSSWNTHFDDLTLPTHVDVGCARGILVKELADRHRGRYNYVGIEVREKLVEEANKTEKNGNCCFLCANLMSSLHQQQLIQGMQEIVPKIERISILFPDPWIKVGVNKSMTLLYAISRCTPLMTNMPRIRTPSSLPLLLAISSYILNQD